MEDDTFEHILQETAHHDTVMAFYYMDENNKVPFHQKSIWDKGQHKCLLFGQVFVRRNFTEIMDLLVYEGSLIDTGAPLITNI